MGSTSETGSAKNLANFKTILSYCEAYGSNYNPSADQIKLSNLLLLFNTAEAAHADCIKKQTLFNNATDARMQIFADLIPKATRIMNALIASGAEENTIKSARSIMHKLLGKRVGKIEENPDPNQPVTENISVSQRSFDKMLEHFTALLEIVQSIPSYQPNEATLQSTQLLTYKTALTDANNQVIQCNTDWSNCRITRYDIMYAPKTGFAATAKLIKTYIKSIFGASSQQYKQLSTLQFSQLPK